VIVCECPHTSFPPPPFPDDKIEEEQKNRTMVADSSSSPPATAATTASAEWLELPRWMREPLEANPLKYEDFLPVQAAVIPYIVRGIRSCLPVDVCLSSPTGSGKTLCYLIPILHLIGEEKRELPEDTRLRAVVVVPTKALGAQVHAVLKRLTSGTNISVVSACGENPAKEAQQLVRRVKLLGADSSCFDDDADDNEGDRNDDIRSKAGDDEDDLDVDLAVRQAMKSGEEEDEAHPTAVAHKDALLYPAGKTLYYSAADILIATPQRLLKHCGTTPGFTLRHLRMLVIDEADQILAAGSNGSGVNGLGTSSSSNFTNLIGRVLQLCEPSTASAASQPMSNSRSNRTAVLHKILCSATLSLHITRISEVRLRNVKHFSLATDGTQLADVDAKVVENATGPLSHFTSRFALPPKLQEHMLTTVDEHRPALLLKLIRHVMSPPPAPIDGGEGSALTNNGSSNTIGKTCIVFCAQSDTARVLAKFLSSCDVDALDFTSTSSVAERRQFVISGVSGKAVVLVTTDALMRGVDLPGVAHVVMYDAPQSLPQFVHRVGRTARAMREGHAYMLLTKKGPSGTLADGEVAKYKALDMYLTRSLPVTYERELQVITDEDVANAATKLQETKSTLESLLTDSTTSTVKESGKREATKRLRDEKKAAA
jgi:superfamily II DNA/RNA helicase